MSKIYAPLTDEEVAYVNEFQRGDHVHPFTCCGRAMIASNAGMTCPHCEVVQGWVWEPMADGSAIKAQEALTAKLLAKKP